MRGSAALNGMNYTQPRGGPQAACLVDAEPRAARLGASALSGSIPQCNWGGLSTNPRAQSSRLAVFGGRGMSFNICRGTLGSLAMFPPAALRRLYTPFINLVHCVSQFWRQTMAIDYRRTKEGRRSGKDRRSGMDTRSEEEKKRVGERRSKIDRRSGLDRRSNAR